MTRKLLLRVVLLSCIFGVALSAQTLFVGSGDNTSSSLYGFRTDPLVGPSTLLGAPNLFLALPSGSRYWVISKNALGTVTVVDSSLTTVLKKFDLGSTPVAAAVTPDGQKILILTSTLRVFSTFNDTEIGTIAGDVGFQPIDLAVSYDSRRAYVLSSGSQRVTPVDLLFYTVSGNPVSVPFSSTAISAGPNGEIYVSAPQTITEYSQDLGSGNLLVRTNFSAFNGTPGKLLFTPDGLHAVSINQNLTFAGPALVFDLVNRMSTGQVPQFGSSFSRVVVTDNFRFYAVAAGINKLYQCSISSPGSVQEASFSGVTGGTFANVQDIAASNEIPQAKSLFVSAGNSLYRTDLTTGTLNGPFALSSTAGGLSWVAPNVSGASPGAILGYNTNQTLASATSSTLPLMVRVLDVFGRPIANTSVTFATANTSVNVAAPFVATGLDGIAGTTVTIPNASGLYTLTGTVNGTGLQTSFTINAGGSGGGGNTTVGGLQVWAGTGQLIPPMQNATEPLTVRVTDTAGNPIPNATVTWVVTDQQGTTGGSVSPIFSTSDASGFATANFTAGVVQGTTGPVGFGQPLGRTTISASTSAQTVNFSAITLADSTGTQPGTLSISLDRPSNHAVAGAVGQTVPGAIQLHVVANGFVPAQGVGVRVFDPADVNTSSLCSGGIIFTDSNGAASCDLVTPPTTGTKALTVRVGSVSDYDITLTVTAGAASKFASIQGDNQSGKPGAQLPVALAATVTDAGGNPVSGAAAQWTVPVAGSVTLSNVVATSNAQGRVSATATLGNTSGTSQVQLSVGGVTYTFNLTVQVTIGGFTLVSGNNQTATVSTAFGQPLVVKITDAQGNAIPNVAVNFAVSSGVATVNTPSAMTAADGTASTTVTAGASAGAITVQATVAGQTPINFSLTARLPGPVFNAAQIVNAASFQAGVSPGALVTIFGTGIAPSGAVLGNPQGLGPLPLKLAGVEVLFGGTAAPIFSVVNNNGQESVTVQVPYELSAPSTTSVTIRVNGASTTIDNVAVKRLTPGIFEMTDAQGRRTAIVLKSDGSFVSTDNPAVRGEKLTVFAAGLGSLTPASFTNRVGVANQTVNAPIVVGVNNAGNGGAYTATLSPTMVGLYQITFQLDANAATGNTIPFSISAQDLDGTRVFSNSSNIAAIR